MHPDRLSITQFAVQAWRDSGRAMGMLLPLTTIAFVICIALAMTQNALVPAGGDFDPKTLTAGSLASIVQAFLLTPYFIAVHRFIILGEITKSYSLAPAAPRFRRFFAWSLLLVAFASIPYIAGALLAASTGARLAIAIVVAIVTTILSIRLVTLFPSIAVDAPDATWRNAVAHSKGHAWGIFFIGLLAILPLVIASIVAVTIGASTGLVTSLKHSTTGPR